MHVPYENCRISFLQKKKQKKIDWIKKNLKKNNFFSNNF